ncbi:hypothetical protein AN948_32785 [Rhodococcus sp. ADH]|uniref:hypothetical protein n=1 Tax=unclassified Rhodococcus (in: high G+C Gram-positive bacteria) TaxID=192944 RepID=UPI0006BA12C9|nr:MULTISPECIES: hypothetical protein [unclassified Rhodococcus (in: high G+C Gram-positive bacteria)]KPH15898.1 hypothetical protein AN948_32785 [Rhodococcus sp. ADH]
MTETSIPTVADIDAEITDATAAVEDLETKVINGDTAVTSTAISKAREKLSFLGLRRKAAEKVEAAQREENHRKSVEGYRTQVAAWSNAAESEMQEAYADIVNSTKRLKSLINARQKQARSYESQASALGLPDPRFPGISEDYLGYAFDEGRTGIRRVHGFITDNSGRHRLHRD